MKKYTSGQFWMETSMAICDDDQIVSSEAGCHDRNINDGILIKITDCSASNPKIHHQIWLKPHELSAMIGMLQSVRDHVGLMKELQRVEDELNGGEGEDRIKEIQLKLKSYTEVCYTDKFWLPMYSDDITYLLQEVERLERENAELKNKLADVHYDLACLDGTGPHGDPSVVDENAQLAEALQDCVASLKTLRGEVRGTLSAHELAIRYDSGNSNWACLEIALKQAEDALAKHRELIEKLKGESK